MDTPEADEISDGEFSDMNHHHRRLNHSHQLNKEVAQEWMKDRDRVSEHLHVHLRRI